MYLMRAPLPLDTGSLTTVNNRASLIDRRISQMVLGDDKVQVHGLVACSVDVDGVNKATLEAAKKMGIPVVGTGEWIRDREK